MEFSRQEYWSGLLFTSPGDLPDPGIEPMCLMSPVLADRFFTPSSTWETQSLEKLGNWVSDASGPEHRQVLGSRAIEKHMIGSLCYVVMSNAEDVSDNSKWIGTVSEWIDSEQFKFS